MKRESSQTMRPVAVREICSCHLERFVTGSADNMLKQHTCLRGPAPLLGLRMLGGKAGLVLTRALRCPGPRFPPASSSLMLRMQSTGGFAKMSPEILQTPSNGTWTEQLTLALSQYLSLAELLLP